MMPMFDEILAHEELRENTLDCVQFGGVEFARDFGPWAKGDRVHVLAFDLDEGTVTSYDNSNKVITSRSITLVAT